MQPALEARRDDLPIRMTLRPDGAYVIVGGFGGFGLALAQRLVDRGARHLVLVGRRGPTDASAAAAVETLRVSGARVEIETLDASDTNAVAALFDCLSGEAIEVHGVFHAAMVLDDALLRNLTPRRIEPVLRAKIAVADALDKATRHLPLDHFVLFSSATTLVGNPGQVNYVAANAYLEALAKRRRARGQAALAVAWGALSDVGYLAKFEVVHSIGRPACLIEGAVAWFGGSGADG